MDDNEVLIKAPHPIVSSPCGSVIVARDEQSENTVAPNDFSPSRSVTDVKDEQLSKALSPIDCRPWGNETEVKEEQF